MCGSEPGRITFRNSRNSLAPRHRAARINTPSSECTPWMVLSRIGKKAPMKVMKTMLASLFGHSMIDIGTQAIAGIGRSTSTTGMNRSRTR